MELYHNVKALAAQRNMSLAELERRLNFSNGQLGKWNKSRPSIDKVQQVADYFNVSIDYLLGRDKQEFQNEDEQIVIMHRAARKMSKEEREKAIKMLEVLFDDWDELKKEE